MDYLGLGDDSLAQPISETMDDETENDTENGVKKAFGFESDLNQISIRCIPNACARIYTDIDKDNILLEGEAGAHRPDEGEEQAAVQPAAMLPELRALGLQPEWDFESHSWASCLA